MCGAQTSALSYEERFLPNRRRTATLAFSRTPVQFIYSWRSGPNQTPCIFHGPSVQRKGSERKTPIHGPNRKAENISRLILVPGTVSYYSDFSADFVNLGTSRYKNSDFVDIGGIPDCVVAQVMKFQVEPNSPYMRRKGSKARTFLQRWKWTTLTNEVRQYERFQSPFIHFHQRTGCSMQ